MSLVWGVLRHRDSITDNFELYNLMEIVDGIKYTEEDDQRDNGFIKAQSKEKGFFEMDFGSLKIRMGINGRIVNTRGFLEVVLCQAECHTWWRFVLSEDSKDLIVMKKRKKEEKFEPIKKGS